MTKKEFEKRAANGKTVIAIQYIEGEQNKGFTAVSGRADLVLEQLIKRVAYAFLQIKRSSRGFPVAKALATFCEALIATYDEMETAYYKGELK